jgi:hypothetical protein
MTLLIILGLFMPLRSSFGRDDAGAIIRILIMLITGILALGSFIQSFRNARKAK